jgi:hypothetical protein
MRLKYFKSIAIAMLTICIGVGTTACGDDEPELTNSVSLAQGISTNIQLTWSDSMSVGVIGFNATGDWTAEILPANSKFEVTTTSKTFSQVDWLEIYPYSGSTGSISTTLYATPNHSSEPRYAVVRINSINNVLEFHVTQQGMPNSNGGDSPTPTPDN